MQWLCFIFAAFYLHLMRLILRQAIISDPRSGLNGQKLDVFIENGFISQLANNIDVAESLVIEADDMHLSPGWIDLFAHFCDPGFEFKETLESGAAAAAAGGYTRVLVVPNTQPCLHAKSQVEYVVNKSNQLPVQVLPMGAISKNCEGKDLAEMYDMQQSGAIAFTDGWNPLQSNQVMLKALQYVKAFDGVIVQIPDDQSLTRLGLVHEGILSTQLGLPGKPAIGETLLVARDIELLRYTGSRLHITGISTAASVELVRKAKAEGLQITCSVTPYHLHFSVDDMATYDTNLKVNPPLRLKSDVQALKEGILDGTIDCIATHHRPHEYDSKICEFEYASYGMEGLESAMGVVKRAIPSLSAKKITELFCLAPARIFNLPLTEIAVGQKANFTIFQPEKAWLFTKENIQSQNTNNAFLNQTLLGKPVGIINGNYVSPSLIHKN